MTRHRPDHEIELFRDGDTYVVILDLPGYDPSKIDLRWHERHLHVHAERASDESSRTAVLNRRVGLPHEIDAARITAEYEDGVLEVSLPIVDGGDASGTRIEVE